MGRFARSPVGHLICRGLRGVAENISEAVRGFGAQSRHGVLDGGVAEAGDQLVAVGVQVQAGVGSGPG